MCVFLRKAGKLKERQVCASSVGKDTKICFALPIAIASLAALITCA